MSTFKTPYELIYHAAYISSVANLHKELYNRKREQMLQFPMAYNQTDQKRVPCYEILSSKYLDDFTLAFTSPIHVRVDEETSYNFFLLARPGDSAWMLEEWPLRYNTVHLVKGKMEMVLKQCFEDDGSLTKEVIKLWNLPDRTRS